MTRLVAMLLLMAPALAAWPAALAAQQPRAIAAKKALPVSGEQLQTWVAQLDAPEFLARDTAMLNLMAAGEPAIAAVQTVFVGDSLEATSRALHVLQQLGLSADVPTQEAARAALVEAAARQESPVLARRAEVVLAQLTELRSAQALVELEALGAKVVRGQVFNGIALTDAIESLQIGPEFKGGVEELRRLKWLAIQRLVLVGPAATDAWLPHAAAMTDLEELHLYQTAVSDEGLAAIAQHQRLRQLGVYYSRLSERGLKRLEKLPLLSFVKLYGTQISRAEGEKFQATTGLAKLDLRKGAFLGVGCLTIDNNCLLSTVHVGSPAEKAGLLQDDVLLRFAKAPVDTFETLTARISELDAGDEVELEVRREVEDDSGNLRAKTIAVKATLAPWELDLAVNNGQRP